MKKISVLLLLACTLGAFAARAQEVQFDSTFTAPKERPINDYIMIGANYGVSFSNVYYSPAKHNRAWQFSPNYISVMFTKHSKMFDILPYFALTMGFAHGYEGFGFLKDPETGRSQTLDGFRDPGHGADPRGFPPREDAFQRGRVRRLAQRHFAKRAQPRPGL